jgi:serine protease Do
MRKVLLSVLISCAVVAGLRADAWDLVVKHAQSAVVYIQVGDKGSCSGVVIHQKAKYVLTAAHCTAGDVLWVDRVKGDVVALDAKKDLAVLRVAELDPSREAVALAAHDPAIRADVMSVGYGYGLERPFFKTAHVSDTSVRLPDGDGGPFIGVDASFTPGQSGGPVFNEAGEVVAIVQLGDGGTLGLGVGADVIRERVGRFFAR